MGLLDQAAGLLKQDVEVSELTDRDAVRRNWQIFLREHKNIYSLALVPVGSARSDIEKGLKDLLNGGPTEFVFRVNPKSMELEEPSAVVIRPTQGGQYIEHQGSIYKNINIMGTTGLRPNMSPSQPPGLIQELKNAFGFSTVSLDPETKLPPEERTGFDDLVDLRNVFRAYNMAKLDPNLAPNVIMIWRNGKEGEYYVVEPISFKTSRDSASPLTANYTIQLRTIKRYDKELVNIISDSWLNRNDKGGLWNRVKGIINGISQSLNIINNHLDAAASSFARILNDIVTPANEILSGLASIAGTSKRFTQAPKFAINSVAQNAKDAMTAIGEAQANFQTSGGEIIAGLGEVKSALGQLARSMLSLSAEDSLFAPSNSEKVNTKKFSYVKSTFKTSAGSGGDPLAVNNINVGTSVSQSVVGANDNIRKLAKRLLGSTSRWKELVIVNNLKAPYISADGDGIDVLRPGDNILYPQFSAGSQTAVVAEDIGKSRTLSPIEERLGRDIFISSPKSAGGVTQFDWVVGDNGDVKLVEGIDNMKQAVRIKFETEQGELSLHPFFGIKYPLGVKIPPAGGFIEFDVNARASLLSDQRIGQINRLKISFSGNTLDVKADVKVKGFDNALTLDFSTRR